LRYSTRAIRSIFHETDNFRVDFDVFLESTQKNLQRELVWEKSGLKNHEDRYYHHRKLIESIFSYTDIGKFVFYEKHLKIEPYFVLQCIDGKQRIHALISFKNNEFGVLRNNVECFYKDMNKSDKSHFLNSSINWARVESKLSDQQLETLFNNINFEGVPQ
jgi:hypothetical protein